MAGDDFHMFNHWKLFGVTTTDGIGPEQQIMFVQAAQAYCWQVNKAALNFYLKLPVIYYYSYSYF